MNNCGSTGRRCGFPKTLPLSLKLQVVDPWAQHSVVPKSVWKEDGWRPRFTQDDDTVILPPSNTCLGCWRDPWEPDGQERAISPSGPDLRDEGGAINCLRIIAVMATMS